MGDFRMKPSYRPSSGLGSANPLYDLLDSDRRPGSRRRGRSRSRSPPPSRRGDRDLMSELRMRDPHSGDLLRRNSAPARQLDQNDLLRSSQSGRVESAASRPAAKDAVREPPRGTGGPAASKVSKVSNASADKGETKVSSSVLAGANAPVYSAKPMKTKTLSIRGVSSTSVQIQNLAPGTTLRDIQSAIKSEVGVDVDPKDCHVFAVKGGTFCVAEIKFQDRKTALKTIDAFDNAVADGYKLEVSLLLDSPEYEAVRNMSTVSGTQHVGGGQSGTW
ncbi:hypothetical protein BCR37DRAFT_251748 [Protomyces lactucae-debilis]|uniref:RRM domain-containing protein n=1 Tax=Protomyces lactucae-debilis TaxID=2754530 RepID=A0A1Y2FLI9_PROLT|nr:uncharacterized protein BCR37DRAFT_251748 [Protomyces lactucae-debilis]ORY84799.1 hypothetical protein BCR37DRAFT_251748 [Protomyces lactucae-debilis]